MSNEKSVLRCQGLYKAFTDVGKRLEVLSGVDFCVEKGKTVAIVGVSGSGKSTLLHLLGGLDDPSKGRVFWGDQDIKALSERKKCAFRNHHLGFVYQFHHLLPEFTAIENVMMPLLLGKASLKMAKEKARDYLIKVGLKDRLLHKVAELSGGERQRAAIARAIVCEPKCVLADEPTGNLDHHSAQAVWDVMLDLQKESGTSFVIVTHDLNLASRMQRQYHLEDGVLKETLG